MRSHHNHSGGSRYRQPMNDHLLGVTIIFLTVFFAAAPWVALAYFAD